MGYRDAIDHGETNVGLGMVPGATEEERMEEEIDRLRTHLERAEGERDEARALLREARDALGPCWTRQCIDAFLRGD